MATQKKQAENVQAEPATATPAKTFESIAVDTLRALIRSKHSEAAKLDIVSRAVSTAEALEASE